MLFYWMPSKNTFKRKFFQLTDLSCGYTWLHVLYYELDPDWKTGTRKEDLNEFTIAQIKSNPLVFWYLYKRKISRKSEINEIILLLGFYAR